MIAQWFKPTLAGVLFLLLYLGLQGATFKHTTTTTFGSGGIESRVERQEYGIPRAIKVSFAQERGQPASTSVDIRWPNLILVLLTGFLVTMSLGRLATGPANRMHPPKPFWKRPVLTIPKVIAVVTVVALLLATGFCRWYWGYWFSPPGLDARVAGATKVISATVVESKREAHAIVFEPSEAPYNPLREVQADPDWEYPFRSRETRTLYARGLVAPRVPVMPAHRIRDLYAILDNTGLLVSGRPGYTATKLLRGVAWELRGPDGERLLFFAGNGQQVSDDHYPYYELLFDDSNPAHPKLISYNRFYYDVAGMEGMTVLRAFFACLVLLLVVVLPVTIIVLGIRRWRTPDAMRARRGFPVEPARESMPPQGNRI